MKRLTVKDLVNAGLFSVLTIAAFWMGGMLGFIPVLMPVVPFMCALVSAPVFMLYSTRIDKFGMVLILGILTGLVFSMSGHGIYALPGSILCALGAEWIMKKGAYKSPRHARWAYTLFVALAAFNLIPMYISREAYIQYLIASGYKEEYVAELMRVMPSWSLIPVVLLGCVGGYIGATIGIKILRKHFERAGMAA